MGDESCPPAKPRRIRRYAIVALVVLVGLSLISTLTRSPQPDAQLAPSLPTGTVLTPATSKETSAPTVSPPPAGFAPTGPTQRATVIRVVDGDTIVVEIDGVQARLRYIGMNTPESNASDADLRALADAATEANRALVDGRDVVLERDVSETDRYDRLLRNVWVQDQHGRLVMVGLELVRTGFAQVSTYPPDVKYVDRLRAAQDEARAAGVGLWASQGSISPAPTRTPAPIQGLVGQGAFDDPWGFDFRPGMKITDPLRDFCSYFDCIASFWNSTKGFVVQCTDGTFSHSGGRRGVCFRHDGYRRTLFAH